MRNSVKFAVSIPCQEYDEMEAIRKKAGVTRSAFILGIFREWRAARLRENAVKSYIAGYRERPEDPTFAEAMARAAAEILSDEDWS